MDMNKDVQSQLCHDVVSSTHGNQRRHSSATSVTRGTSPLHKVECTRKKTTCYCGQQMLKKNLNRHYRRCHQNMPEAEQMEMKQPGEPPEVARQRCKTQQRLPPSATSTATRQVVEGRSAVTEQQTAAEAVVTSPLLAVETNQQRRPAQSRAPATHRVTSQRATSPAARIKGWQDDAERRGSPRPRDVRQSSSSRSPAREAHGYQRRDARRDRCSRSPRRAERRPTPKSSPPRHFQYERGRDDARRNDRPEIGRASCRERV